MSDHATLAAAWRHRDAADGFEVLFLDAGPDGGRRLTGHVVIQLTRLAGHNAVVSGLFLDTVDAPLISMMR